MEWITRSEGKSYPLHLYGVRRKDSVCVLFHYDLQTFKYTYNIKYVFLAIKNFLIDYFNISSQFTF